MIPLFDKHLLSARHEPGRSILLEIELNKSKNRSSCSDGPYFGDEK